VVRRGRAEQQRHRCAVARRGDVRRCMADRRRAEQRSRGVTQKTSAVSPASEAGFTRPSHRGWRREVPAVEFFFSSQRDGRFRGERWPSMGAAHRAFRPSVTNRRRYRWTAKLGITRCVVTSQAKNGRTSRHTTVSARMISSRCPRPRRCRRTIKRGLRGRSIGACTTVPAPRPSDSRSRAS